MKVEIPLIGLLALHLDIEGQYRGYTRAIARNSFCLFTSS
jgi:hypothetical protein